jgi:dihydroxyacid dehydratase/phosphogluconate dehydratase
MAARSARAALLLVTSGVTTKDILTPAALDNAMVLHAAFGGSTNLIMHLAAIAFHAGLRRPAVEEPSRLGVQEPSRLGVQEWTRFNRQTPRLVDALPNGPRNFPTVQVFLAGGVPEVMLHLRRAGLLNTGVQTVAGCTLGAALDWWEHSERRATLRRLLKERDGIDPGDVIMSPDDARRRGLTSTVCFPVGNLAPGGAVIKATAIDPSVVNAGDSLVLMCRGPLGAGMEETYQLTGALKYLPFGKHVALLTDARFSGVSTGACIGHVTPEALAGGPIGKLLDGDIVEIVIDRNRLEGSVNLIGQGEEIFGAEAGVRLLASRPLRADLAPDPALPADTRLWAALQEVSGGPWGGSVYDVDKILQVLAAGKRALAD